jgi:hypothetical protein
MLQHFHRIATGIDVSGAVAQIADHPELWNAHPGRTREDSPHYGVPDIWVRFRDPAELTTPESFREAHTAMNYPAWDALPAVGVITNLLMDKVRPKELGGILITKIPSGGLVKPHHDRGGWHAEYYNTKVYVPLKSNDSCINYCEDEFLMIRAGEAVIFNNLLMHSVENNGTTDRITLIVCMRTEK